MRASSKTRLAELPRARIEPHHVLELADLPPEDLGTLLSEWKRFTPKGLETLEALAGAAAPSRAPLKFDRAEHYTTGIEQQSALAFISPAFGFVAVGDDSSELWQVKPKQGGIEVARLRRDDGELDGIEGSCFYRRTGRLRVVSEDSRKLWELKIEDGRASEPQKIGKIEKLGKKKNKGTEGIEILPAELSPDRTEYQLAVNEGKPRRVAFLDPTTLEVLGLADVPESVKAALPDLSDLAVSPNGTLFLLSDEGNAFVELAIRKVEISTGGGRGLPRWTLIPLEITHIDLEGLPLGNAPRLQPEGLSFDHHGDLWVACEANGILIRFAQQT
jgi:uncharacterized protein YjiK